MTMDENRSVASSVASMKKWGIPQQQTPEIALLERLVWVKYKSRWWPALLYHSYSELQSHLYDQLDMVLKAQFAMAIMRQMQERRKIKVARLLGKSILEIVEVGEDGYCEFYWQLPNILPRACKQSHYGGDLEMYFDFHRALDEVEDIIREVSQENFALLPDAENHSWLERAHMAVEQGDDSSGVFHTKGGSRRKKNSSSIAASSAKVTAPEDMHYEIAANSSITSAKSTSAKSTSAKSTSRKGSPVMQVEPTPSSLSATNSIREAPSESKSKRSTRTKASQAVTEIVDNRVAQQDSFVPDEESREPIQQNRADVVEHNTPKQSQETRVPTPFEVVPGLEGDDIVPGLSARVDGARSTLKNVLGFMSGSREEGMPNNLEHTQATSHPTVDIPSRPPSVVNGAKLPHVTNKEMRSVVSPQDAAYVETSPMSTANKPPMSFWQRMTCYSTDY